MRGKLTLKLEDLSVDSFDTTTAQKAKGTVFGEQCTCNTQCTCPGCPTCAATCANTCDNNTCAGCGGGTDYTDCDCMDTCLQTACGPYFCCA